MFETWTVLSSWIGPRAKRVEGGGRVEGAAVSPFFAAPFFSAARMSTRTMRPPGPEPVTRDGSRPFSAASLRASGEILTRSLDDGAAVPSPADERGEGAASPVDAGFGAATGCGAT